VAGWLAWFAAALAKCFLFLLALLACVALAVGAKRAPTLSFEDAQGSCFLNKTAGNALVSTCELTSPTTNRVLQRLDALESFRTNVEQRLGMLEADHTHYPTSNPTASPTAKPTFAPSFAPTASPTPEPTHDAVCGVRADPNDFSFDGTASSVDDTSIKATKPHTYVALSCAHHCNDMFDNVFGVWGKDGATYRAQNGKPGGMELNFGKPTAISEFKVHCIHSNHQEYSSGTCYANGQYDIQFLKVQYHDGVRWQTISHLNGRHRGIYSQTITSTAYSRNWRFYFSDGQHPNGDAATHLSEIEITNICQSGAKAKCAAVNPGHFSFAGTASGVDSTTKKANSDNTYVALSCAHHCDDMFDNVFGVWGKDGATYRAQNGRPGGMEMRFAKPTNIKRFKIHCIHSSHQEYSSGTCYANGQYDIQFMKVQYHDGRQWVTTSSVSSRQRGVFEMVNPGSQLATNWRFYFSDGQHPNGDAATHLSEIEILEACS
jgi:hypothetical protein